MSGDHTLDKLISYCKRHGIHIQAVDTVPIRLGRDGNIIRVGNIVFDCHEHDTGAHVRGWIIAGAESYEFISTHYWYSSRYTHNDSKWEKGAWDAAVDEAILMLGRKVELHRREAKAQQEKESAAADATAQERKAIFERQFLS